MPKLLFCRIANFHFAKDTALYCKSVLVRRFCVACSLTSTSAKTLNIYTEFHEITTRVTNEPTNQQTNTSDHNTICRMYYISSQANCVTWKAVADKCLRCLYYENDAVVSQFILSLKFRWNKICRKTCFVLRVAIFRSRTT